MSFSSSTPSPESSQNVKERLLAVAGPLFAKHGRNGLSVRQITAEADANLAAVNYHFGSKDGLFHAVCLQHVRRLNETKLAALEAAEKAAAPAPLTLEQILDCAVRPMVTLLSNPNSDHLLMARMIMNEFQDPQSPFAKLMRDELQPVSGRFIEKIMEILPGASENGIAWGYFFYSCTMMHVMMSLDKIPCLYPRLSIPKDSEETIQKVVTYGAAGLRSLAGATQEH
ncbi:MAG: TetR/AcrR family transcriptional regulator [Puniceicoccales bacterium]|jgi:AcrR family transcriptional regulator|nr:TetR/AcrR family transcriptional regulator [Puniceicoccales bacterium]